MGGHNIKLVLSDIDGTILPYGQHVVSERMRAAMHRCLDAGIRVGPASGRGISHVAPAFGGDDALIATALGTNGMQVHLDGRLIHEEHLDHAALEHVLDAIDGLPGVGAIVFDLEGRPLLVRGRREDLVESFPIYAQEALDRTRIPEHPIIKMNVFVAGGMGRTRATFDHVSREVPELDFNIPVAGFLNITPVGYSKATGVDILCEALGIGIEQVVVFGDSGNDVEMLAHVPNSAVVQDASDEATAAARWHIGPCERDAVADVLEALARGEWPFGS
jgi:HAD superfamily hydrolase (TIGR01484 family)